MRVSTSVFLALSVSMLLLSSIQAKTLTVGGPGLVGGVQKSSKKISVKDAVDQIVSAVELAPRAAELRTLLTGAKIVEYSTQVVAGINKYILLKTNRGYECFRIWEQLSGENSLQMYSRNKCRKATDEGCRKFDGTTADVLVQRIFA